MATREEFEKVLTKNRYDTTARLVYADWLEEHDMLSEADAERRKTTREWVNEDKRLRSIANEENAAWIAHFFGQLLNKFGIRVSCSLSPRLEQYYPPSHPSNRDLVCLFVLNPAHGKILQQEYRFDELEPTWDDAYLRTFAGDVLVKFMRFDNAD